VSARVLLAAIVLAGVVALPGAAAIGPTTPVNLEAVGATETSVSLAWGPSQPGAFLNLGQPRQNAVTVGWGASVDLRGAVSYQLTRDGVLVASGLTQPSYTLQGLGPKVVSMRLCVTASNPTGQTSAPTCGTWTR
jgi:hypothetical protein